MHCSNNTNKYYKMSTTVIGSVRGPHRPHSSKSPQASTRKPHGSNSPQASTRRSPSSNSPQAPRTTRPRRNSKIVNIGNMNIKRGVMKDYKFEEEIGSGEFGNVFKAIHIKSGRVVAIKRILI